MKTTNIFFKTGKLQILLMSGCGSHHQIREGANRNREIIIELGWAY
jgi:hypothetical protein